MPLRIALLAALAILTGCGGGADRRSAATPTPEPRHFTPAATAVPTATPAPTMRYLVAELRRTTLLRNTPGGKPMRRLEKHTLFGSPAALSVLQRRGRWLRVLSAALPNGRSGWIPARNARLAGTDYAIRIDRSARRARLTLRDRTVFSFTIAVGRPGAETPLGRFAVTDKVRPTDPTSPYGCCAVALTGHQTKLQPGWPGGDRLAIHNTPATWSIGQAASLGCMRAAKRPMERLLRRLPLGSPVFITA